MKTVKVFSKQDFLGYIKNHEINDSTVEQFTNVVIISISCVDTISNRPFKLEHSNVLSIAFDDASEIEPNHFTEEQAKQVNEFLKQHNTKTNFLVHCDAGKSRSGAVGEYIVNYHNLSYQKFKQDNPQVHPNSHVLSTLNRYRYFNLL